VEIVQEVSAPDTPEAEVTVYPAEPVRAGRPLPRDFGPLPGGSLATGAMILLGACAALHLASAAAQLVRYRMLETLIGGGRLPVADLRAVTSAIGLLSWAQLLLTVGTAVVFCVWFVTAYQNVRRLGASGLTYAAGWAAGGFFVPILSLFVPYVIAQETWKASGPGIPVGDRRGWRDVPGSMLVRAWWACWLLASFTSLFADLMGRFAPRHDLRPHQTAALAYAAAHGLTAAAAVLALILVQKIRERQNRRHEAALPGGTSRGTDDAGVA
jgi:hypothetical protein